MSQALHRQDSQNAKSCIRILVAMIIENAIFPILRIIKGKNIQSFGCRLDTMVTWLITFLILGAAGHADPIHQWTVRNPLPTWEDLTLLAAGGGKYVAFAATRAPILGPGPTELPPMTVLTSSNAVGWVAGSVTADYIRAVAYGNGQFVAVGFSVSGEGCIFTSPDGINWIQPLMGGTGVFEDVTYAAGLFVAVGDFYPSSGGSAIWTSPDGIAWRARQSGTTNSLLSINYGNGQFVARGCPCSYENPDHTTLISTNGADWFPVQEIGTNLGLFIWETSDSGKFAAARYSDNALLTSSDGTNWTELGATTPGLPIAYGNNQFITLSNGMLYYLDGTNWIQSPAGATDDVIAICYKDGLFVASGRFGMILTSSDGANWVQREPQGPKATLRGVAYGKRSIHCRRGWRSGFGFIRRLQLGSALRGWKQSAECGRICAQSFHCCWGRWLYLHVRRWDGLGPGELWSDKSTAGHRLWERDCCGGWCCRRCGHVNKWTRLVASVPRA